MNPENEGAAAFYERLGMERLPADDGGRSYGERFTASPNPQHLIND
jgi:hypothetical protein